jgi:hypothetical protein
MKKEQKTIRPDYRLLKEKIETLLKSQPQLQLFLLYLRSRERSSSRSDLYQLTTSIKKFTNNQLTTENIRSFLVVFEAAGVGKFQIEDNRPKFEWEYWIIPLFNSRSQTCFGIELKSIDALRKSGHNYSRIMSEIKERELAFEQGIKNEGNIKIDVLLFEGQKAPGPLSKFSIEDLVTEIQTRGFELTLKPSKKNT